MARVQKQFEAFDELIKLGRFEENQTLRDKRDIIRNKLETRLPKIFEEHKETCPKFHFRNQGSYEMGTGTKPLDGDYDIDQGLYFAISTEDYPDPVVLKQRVYEALIGHTQNVRLRQPCVTVFYQQAGESVYHVDIAVYSDESKNGDGKARLARGKEHSAKENRYWEIADPEGLSDTIFSRFTNSDRGQFRRVVRYLKRWKCENFSKDGHAAPVGIGLTIAAYDHFEPTYTDPVAYKADDLGALRILVRAIVNRFALVWDATEQKSVWRLTIKLPVEPRDNPFERMTNLQMVDLKEKLENLLMVLDVASSTVDPVEACKMLQNEFGKDFPIPSKEETSKRHALAIVSSSNSA